MFVVGGVVVQPCSVEGADGGVHGVRPATVLQSSVFSDLEVFGWAEGRGGASAVELGLALPDVPEVVGFAAVDVGLVLGVLVTVITTFHLFFGAFLDLILSFLVSLL